MLISIQRVFTCLLLSSCFASTLAAQDTPTPVDPATVIRCHTHHKHQEMRASDPGLDARRADINAQIDEWIATHPSTSQDAVIIIPVVVHVLTGPGMPPIYYDQIRSQIDVLSQDFRRSNPDKVLTPNVFSSVAADTEIDFCLADTDPNGNYTSGVTYTTTSVDNIGNTSAYYLTASGGHDIWDPDSYLNIWVCQIGDGILGFTFQPGVAPANRDGMVIDYRYFGNIGTATPPYNLGRTTTHELGHWFNLEHIWGDAFCGNDGVADTPEQETFTSGCPSFPQFSCNNNADGGDMFMNYMDYSNDACMNLFTAGQKQRMLATIDVQRPGLKSSNGCSLNSVPSWRGSDFSESLSVFPNPSTGEFTAYIEFNAPSTVDLRVYNQLGQVVERNQFTQFYSGNLPIDLSQQPAGLYLVELTTPFGIATKKVQVLEH
ncbi:MAG: M43 family zinc metalloprotease [Salibacteraceae bacterium]